MAVLYVLRALVSGAHPAKRRLPLAGHAEIPARSLLDPPPGAAVVGGNVETSQRIVDVLLGAIGRVAASQGTMNNLAFGDAHFGYYETIGGGAGASAQAAGASGVPHAHDEHAHHRPGAARTAHARARAALRTAARQRRRGRTARR